MSHASNIAPDIQYRRYYAMVFDGKQTYDNWMKQNRLAFHVLNPKISSGEEAVAFKFWMMETYEGQFALA